MTSSSQPQGLSPAPAELAHDREALEDASMGSTELDAMFGELARETVDRPMTLRTKLAEQPTWLRIVAAATLAFGVAAVSIATMGSHDHDGGLGVSGIGALVAVTVFLVWAVAMGLRGHHQRPLGRGVWWRAGAVLLMPAALGLLPGLWGSEHGAPSNAVAAASMCFSTGTVLAAVVLGICWLFRRDDAPVDWRAAFGGAAGGLSAFIFLQTHCPHNDPVHLVLGHGMVGIVLAGVSLLAARFGLRRRA